MNSENKTSHPGEAGGTAARGLGWSRVKWQQPAKKQSHRKRLRPPVHCSMSPPLSQQPCSHPPPCSGRAPGLARRDPFSDKCGPSDQILNNGIWVKNTRSTKFLTLYILSFNHEQNSTRSVVEWILTESLAQLYMFLIHFYLFKRQKNRDLLSTGSILKWLQKTGPDLAARKPEFHLGLPCGRLGST